MKIHSISKVLAITIILLANSALAQSQETTTDTANPPAEFVIKKSENNSIFKGVLLTVWGKLRSLSPKANARKASRSKVTATIGIRGAENTETLLQPYWKDDRTTDKAFQAELSAYSLVQTEIDNGNLQKGSADLESFLKQYPDSILHTNALFTKGLLLGAMGEKEQSIGILNEFIQVHKTHPLAADAKQVIAALSAQ